MLWSDRNRFRSTARRRTGQLDTSTIEETINQQEIAYQKKRWEHSPRQGPPYASGDHDQQYENWNVSCRAEDAAERPGDRQGQSAIRETCSVTRRRCIARPFSSAWMSSHQFLVEQAQLELEIKRTEIDV